MMLGVRTPHLAVHVMRISIEAEHHLNWGLGHSSEELVNESRHVAFAM
jgi:hypothetical protein